MLFLATVDWRVAPLVMLIKQWAKNHGINDASQGTLSSYSYVLMIISYLQGRSYDPSHNKAWWPSGLSVRLMIGRSQVRTPGRVIRKTLKMVLSSFLSDPR